MAQTVKNLPAMWETQVRSLGQDDPLEKEMATHSIFLPGKSHGQRSLEMLFLLLYPSANSTAGTKGRYYLAVISRLQRQRILAGYSLWGCKESDMTEQLTLSFIKIYLCLILNVFSMLLTTNTFIIF